jgi:hypothetical protein
VVVVVVVKAMFGSLLRLNAVPARAC